MEPYQVAGRCAGANPHARRRQYLSFQLGGLEYGLDFAKVQELRPYRELERFSSEGNLISGVGSSRGVIMPVVDMRIAFSSQVAPPGPATDVIILRLFDSVVGMLVDGVTDIIGLSCHEIHPLPGAGVTEDVNYLLGIGETDGRRLILIDIDRLMSIRRGTAAERVA